MKRIACWLTTALSIVSVVGCTTIARYHQQRSDPVPTQHFTHALACQVGAKQHVRDTKAHIDPDKVDVTGSVRSCIAGKRSDAQLAEVLATERLFDFIYSSLPRGWFSPYAPARSDFLEPHIEVTARRPESAREAVKAFFTTLSDRGQQAVIEASRTLRAEDGIKHVESLIKMLSSAAVPQHNADPLDGRRQVSLLISTSFNSNSPADRLEKAYIFIRPLGGVKIVDVEKPVLETARNIVNLGKETTTQEVSPTLGIEGLAIGPDAKGKIGLSSKFGRTLERTLTKQFALRSVSLNPDQDILFVRQEGQEGIDISGNILSTVTVQVPSRPALLTYFSFDKNSKIVPEAVTIQNVGDVDTLVAWVAVARLVTDGKDTVSEEDDVVEPRVFSGQFLAKLWRNPVTYFSLQLSYGAVTGCTKVPLVYFDETERRARRIAFKDHAAARKFKEHLIKVSNAPGAIEQATLQVETRDGAVRVGFPVANDGAVDPKSASLKWAKSEDPRENLASLTINVSEPSDFPITGMQERGPCSHGT